jgi:hypothetical protein
MSAGDDFLYNPVGRSAREAMQKIEYLSHFTACAITA